MSLTQQSKILNALRAGPITSRDMINMGIFKYSSRIAELRQRGYQIRAERLRHSLWVYHLETSRQELNPEEANAFLQTLPPKPTQGSLL